MVRVLLATLIVVGCASGASPSSPPVELGTGDPNARAETDGVVVELWLVRTEVAIGDFVLALVRVSNNGTVALSREANTCGVGPAPTKIEQRDDSGGVPFGKRWAGRADVFKRALINQAGLGAQRDLGTFWDATMVGTNVLCTLESRIAPFAPGSTDQMRLAWQASAGDGSVIVPGPAVISSTFESPQWGVNPAPLHTVTAEVEIEIVNPDSSDAPIGPTLVDYVDAALSVDAFRDWIDNAPVGIPIDPTYSFWPTAEGSWPEVAPYTNMAPRPVVEIGAFLLNEGGEGEEYRAVVIDRFTGNFLALRTERPSGAEPRLGGFRAGWRSESDCRRCRRRRPS